MKNVSDIVEAAGGKLRVREELQLGREALDKAIRDNIAPASWFDALERLTQKPVNRALFNFKGLP